jgi:O-antigen ligase
MLGQAALIALHGWLAGPSDARRWKAVTFIVFFAAVLVSNQRTATFATIGGVIAILSFVPRRRDTTILGAAIIACALGIGVLGIALLSGKDMTEYLPRSLQMVVLEQGSYGWRLDQWDIYFQMYLDAPLLDQMVGQPFGVLRVIGLGFSTLTQQDPRVLPAHSEYLQLLLDVGAAGLLIFVLVTSLAFAQAVAARKEDRRSSALVGLAAAIVVSQMIFSYSYSFGSEQGLLLALSVQIVSGTGVLRRRAQVDEAVSLESGVDQSDQGGHALGHTSRSPGMLDEGNWRSRTKLGLADMKQFHSSRTQ